MLMSAPQPASGTATEIVLEFCSKTVCAVAGSARFVTSRAEALRLVQDTTFDPLKHAAARNRLVVNQGSLNGSRVAHHAASAQLVDLLLTGRLHYHVRQTITHAGIRTAGQGGSTNSAAPVSKSSSSSSSSSRSASSVSSKTATTSQEPSTFTRQTDFAAQAGTLKAAAASGIPFCEECAAAAGRAKPVAA